MAFGQDDGKRRRLRVKFLWGETQNRQGRQQSRRRPVGLCEVGRARRRQQERAHRLHLAVGLVAVVVGGVPGVSVVHLTVDVARFQRSADLLAVMVVRQQGDRQREQDGEPCAEKVVRLEHEFMNFRRTEIV